VSKKTLTACVIRRLERVAGLALVVVGLTLRCALAQETPVSVPPAATATATAHPTPPTPAPGSIPGPTGAQLRMGSENGFGIGALDPEPTALYGPNRVSAVLPDNGNVSTLSIPLYYVSHPTPDQRWLLELEGDNTQFGLDFSYTYHPVAMPGVFIANVFYMDGRMQNTDSGRIDVGLLDPRNVAPWYHQLGGGVEYSQPVARHLQLAFALNYRQTAVYSGPFTARVPALDALGNPLTLSSTGIDHMFSARLAALYTKLDNPQFPTSGTKVRFSGEQTIPTSGADINSTRFGASWTRFFPVHLFSFHDGPCVLILNAEAATMLGDTPGYDAYNFGGVNSVRGWEQGGLGTGQSFFESTIEYRFPIAHPKIFGTDIDLRGAIYADYGTDLGTAGAVLGRPALVRGKPGEGSGIGAGLQVPSAIGLIRLESGFNNLGGFSLDLTIGDRY